jgi:hypothetical protein
MIMIKIIHSYEPLFEMSQKCEKDESPHKCS